MIVVFWRADIVCRVYMMEMEPSTILILITCSCLLAACQAQTNDTTIKGSADVFVKVLSESAKVIVGWKQDVQTDNKRVELTLTGLQVSDR